MIDMIGMQNRSPRIFFCSPCMDHKIYVDMALCTFKKLHEHGGNIYLHKGLSDISLARNVIAHRYHKKTDYEWMMLIDSDISFSDQDWDFLWEGDEDIVTAPYARKIPGTSPATFGLGFTRVHRRVFDAIEQLENPDGAESAQRFYMDGEIHTHFFPNGVTGDSRWLGEDRGFFTLCSMTGINYRIENRCHLQHTGIFVYGYPDQSNGAKFWKPPEDSIIENSGSSQCVKHGIENCLDCRGEDRPIVVM